MRCARPCAMDVLPTPASPTSTGLFLERRPRIRTVRFSSSPRPMSGSSLPSRAACVRSWPYFRVWERSTSSAAPLARWPPCAPACGWPLPSATRSAFSSRARACCTCSRAASRLPQSRSRSRSLVPLPSSWRTMACSRCEVLTDELFCSRAQSMQSSSTRFAPEVKGISRALPPAPRPTTSSRAARSSAASASRASRSSRRPRALSRRRREACSL
mmetsp:Transcript_48802/g.147975  ORF Transcript_48802/g.147975 Transcript_48802/m.147975 type:complete len:215 (+) Transcript_48802:2114-2758(+)